MQWLLGLLRRLLSKEQRRFIKFCIVGASGIPVNLIGLWVGYHFIFLSLGETARMAGASLFGIAISIFTNFLLNDIWTWRDRDAARGVVGRLLRFYLVCSLASAIQFGTAMGLTSVMGLLLSIQRDRALLMAQLVGIVLATVVNFIANNLWTFRARGSQAASDPEKSPPPP